jgi:hypothetical protein
VHKEHNEYHSSFVSFVRYAIANSLLERSVMKRRKNIFVCFVIKPVGSAAPEIVYHEEHEDCFLPHSKGLKTKKAVQMDGFAPQPGLEPVPHMRE